MREMRQSGAAAPLRESPGDSGWPVPLGREGVTMAISMAFRSHPQPTRSR
ncbi:hypothetical protein PIIN_01449 [Serendipita indica DSM 11827]|uniref:Uncharacterized protein n=1 Tax=Serendipita indica (strain DSM 11827) TaxID=1109443 RepID=G4T8H8_SERID|nr:hypothetical protein PIIN_01449 [Serendipita indica DSM 11827]